MPLPPPGPNVQFLIPDNTSDNKDESLEGRVKDPLWFLARQWQTGEFEGESGGRPAFLDVAWNARPVDGIRRGEGGEPDILAPEMPLECAVEHEDDGVSPAWRSEALEYAFSVHAGDWSANAQEYEGSDLDWFHFDADAPNLDDGTDEQYDLQTAPASLTYRGMPDPRWWKLEEMGSYVDTSSDLEPNFLSMMLPEFLVADANNWYLAVLEMDVGRIHEISAVKMIDNFGISKDIPQTQALYGEAWNVFGLAQPDGDAFVSGALFLPNVDSRFVEGDPTEEVVFNRDEAANLVWALERFYEDAAGNVIAGAEDNRLADLAEGPPMEVGLEAPGELPSYTLKSQTSLHAIPFVPRLLSEGAGGSAETYLRRGRTHETASMDNPQHRSRTIAESWKIHEEEIPRTGVRVRHQWRFARLSTGEGVFWRSRKKDPIGKERRTGLQFDYLDNRSDNTEI